ncbi:MAG: B12-binding domain-containing radical SAM protein [Planctomycetota bacterium]
MVSVLLVQPPHRDTFGYSMPPLGILHVGAEARARGHAVSFLDLALLVRRGELPAGSPAAARALIPACVERILQAEPEVLGLGAMVSSMPAALHLAAEVRRRRPELRIILGGQGPESVEEAVLARHPAIDAVAVGEADHTLADWLDALGASGTSRTLAAARRSGESEAVWAVPGLVLRRDGAPFRTPGRPLLRAVDGSLDAVPPPAWDLAEPPAAYAAAAGEAAALFPIDLGRGCTYACTFCTTPVFWGRSARHLSPARAVDELDRLAALGHVDCAYVTHDLFTFDRERVLAICAEKRRRGNTLPWECRTRIDLVDEELLVAMSAAGCRRILYGVESDRPEVLLAMNKGGRAAQCDVRGTLRTAQRAGVASILGTMAGVPGETAADVESNLQLMARAAVIDGVSLSLHWFNVTPGNGQAAVVESARVVVAQAAGAGASAALKLLPGLHADLVRGHDLPAGFVAPEQAALIAADAEIFAAFRVFTPGHTAERRLYLLTRNAHLLLEALPRTARALAAARGSTLLETLGDFLETAAVDYGFAPGSVPTTGTADAPGESALFAEPLVLQRAAGVAALAAHARAAAQRLGDPRLAALADYEEALLATDSVRVLRFVVNPLPLVRALDADEPLPPAEGPAAVLFTRRGERTAARVIAPLLADVAEGLDAARLAERWPDLPATAFEQARAVLLPLVAAPLVTMPTPRATAAPETVA